MNAQGARGANIQAVQLTSCPWCGSDQRLTIVTPSERVTRCFGCGETSRVEMGAQERRPELRVAAE